MNRRSPSRLPRWHEWSIHAGFAVLLLTGLAWLGLDKWVRVAGEFGPEHHPAQHLLLIVHGVAAYLFLLAAGALIPVHVKLGWSTRRNLLSGLALASVLGLLALTALGLYYVADEALRGWTSLVHWLIGIVAVAALAIHVIRGLRSFTPPPKACPRRRGRRTPDG